MQCSKSFPCLHELLDVSPYEKTFNSALLAQDSILFDHNYAGWAATAAFQPAYKLIRRSSLPFQECSLRKSYQCFNKENPVVFMGQSGRPMLQRRARRRFVPYGRPTGDKLPVLSVDEVERILNDIETGTYENAESSESKDSASTGTALQYFRSVPHYSKKEEDSSHYQMMSPDEEEPTFKYAKDSSESPDFNFDIVEC